MKATRTQRRDKSPNRDTSPSPLAREVAELAELLRSYDLNEIEVERQGQRILLRRGVGASGAPSVAAHPMTAPVATAAAPVAAAPPAPPAQMAETTDGNVSYITSPFVGTFYRSPGPDSAPFVDVGTRVRKGQVLCIVEAMKLMNEIESEIDGVILQLLVENGHPVEYGEPLFKIKQG